MTEGSVRPDDVTSGTGGALAVWLVVFASAWWSGHARGLTEVLDTITICSRVLEGAPVDEGGHRSRREARTRPCKTVHNAWLRRRVHPSRYAEFALTMTRCHGGRRQVSSSRSVPRWSDSCSGSCSSHGWAKAFRCFSSCPGFSWLGGTGVLVPGLLATTLSAAAANVFLLTPEFPSVSGLTTQSSCARPLLHHRRRDLLDDRIPAPFC